MVKEKKYKKDIDFVNIVLFIFCFRDLFSTNKFSYAFV